MGRSGGLLGAALLLTAVALPALRLVRRLGRSWRHRVAVRGHSMEPTVREGDWLLVDPLAYAGRAPAPGDLLVVPDPDVPGRWLVKRVASADHAGGSLIVAGDHPGHALDAGTRTTVAAGAVIGRPWLRYWPPSRIGRPR